MSRPTVTIADSRPVVVVDSTRVRVTAIGVAGPPGSPGTAGAQGLTGPAVFLGAEPGEDGMVIPGPPGSPGVPGAAGGMGPPGMWGEDGEEGPRGGAGPNVVDITTATKLTGYLKGNGTNVTTVTTVPAADLTGVVVLAPASSVANVIVPTGDFVPLTIQGGTGGTADLLRLKTTAGDTVLTALAGGSVTLGGPYPANSQLTLRFTGQETGGLKLSNTATGNEVVLSTIGGPSLYITSASGGAVPLTIAQIQSPADSSTLTAGSGSWYLTGGTGCQFGVNTTPFTTPDQVQLSVATKASTVVGQTIKLSASHSVDAFRVASSIGTTLASIDQNGGPTFGGTLMVGLISGNKVLRVDDAATSPYAVHVWSGGQIGWTATSTADSTNDTALIRTGAAAVKVTDGSTNTGSLLANLKPVHQADSAAANDTIYYSTTASKLVYKDSGGTVNNLY
jgi:hypothetical protein